MSQGPPGVEAVCNALNLPWTSKPLGARHSLQFLAQEKARDVNVLLYVIGITATTARAAEEPVTR